MVFKNVDLPTRKNILWLISFAGSNSANCYYEWWILVSTTTGCERVYTLDLEVADSNPVG